MHRIREHMRSKTTILTEIGSKRKTFQGKLAKLDQGNLPTKQESAKAWLHAQQVNSIIIDVTFATVCSLIRTDGK
jgi:hypothetical protein